MHVIRASVLGLWLPLAVKAVHGAKILQSNDDGWAEKNIRVFFDALTAAGHNVVLSAPAQNESGTGSLDADPTPLAPTMPCEFDSCPPGSPAIGSNASQPRLNYVNSYPVTSVRYGLSQIAPRFFDSSCPTPDLVVTGPNVGSNIDIAVPFSGTVGAASYAAHTAGIPAIAFSGATGDQIAWNVEPTPLYVSVYADLATNLTNAVLDSGRPYLPADTFLNVNFPAVVDGSSQKCGAPGEFKFVLSRIFPTLLSDDVATCGSSKLPTERSVIDTTSGCYVAVSVGNAGDKTTANKAAQAVVLKKLANMLSCLPST